MTGPHRLWARLIWLVQLIRPQSLQGRPRFLGGMGSYPSRGTGVLNMQVLVFPCCRDQGRFSPLNGNAQNFFPISLFSVVPELVGAQAHAGKYPYQGKWSWLDGSLCCCPCSRRTALSMFPGDGENLWGCCPWTPS